MATVTKVEGLKELEAALHRLPASVGKRMLRAALRKMGQPIADDAASKAPRDDGTLQRSIGVGSRLTRRQRSQHRRMFRDDRASAEVFVGAGGLPQAHMSEFGTFKDPAQPFLRPAWDSHKGQLVDQMKAELWAAIDKRAAREARKAARLAKKMGG